MRHVINWMFMVLFRTAYTLGIEPFLAMQAMKMQQTYATQLMFRLILDHSFVIVFSIY
jgi:hypothetical protein